MVNNINKKLTGIFKDVDVSYQLRRVEEFAGVEGVLYINFKSIGQEIVFAKHWMKEKQAPESAEEIAMMFLSALKNHNKK